MTLEMAGNVGGEFTDFMALIAATPEQKLMCVVKIREYKNREQAKAVAGQAPRENFPVVADVLMANGPRAGEAVLAETFLNGAVTATLRGVRNPKDPAEPVQPPRSPNTGQPWGPGTELGVTFKVGKMGATAYLQANEPTVDEGAVIGQVYADGQAWANAQATAARQSAVTHAQQYGPAVNVPAHLTPQHVAVQQAVAPPAPAQDPAYAAFLAQQAAAQAPPAPAAPPVDPAYAAWLASQQQAAPAPAPAGVGGVPGPAPWQG